MLLAFFSVISVLLGIFRDRLLAMYVGVGPTLDVYNASFRIPDLVYGILFSFVSAVTVVPFLTKAVHEKDSHSITKRFNSLFFFFVISIIAISLIVIALLPFLSKYIVPGFDASQRESFVFFSSVMMLQPLLLGISALISCLSQVKHRFILYSLAPLAYTVSIILSIVFLYKLYGLNGIIFGVIAGALLSLLVQSVSLFKERVSISYKYFDWDLIKDHFKNASPRSGSVITSRLRDVVYVSFATLFGAGALTIYIFAQKVMDVFIQVVVQSIATASLPSLAKHHSIGEVKEFKKLFSTNLILVFFVSCVATAVCFFASDFIVLVLYGHVARFEEVSRFIVLLAVNLPFYAINTYFVSAFNATKDGFGLFLANLVSTISALIALFIFKEKGYGLESLIYSTWVLGVAYLLALLFLYRSKIQHYK